MQRSQWWEYAFDFRSKMKRQSLRQTYVPYLRSGVHHTVSSNFACNTHMIRKPPNWQIYNHKWAENTKTLEQFTMPLALNEAADSLRGWRDCLRILWKVEPPRQRGEGEMKCILLGSTPNSVVMLRQAVREWNDETARWKKSRKLSTFGDQWARQGVAD